MAALLNRADLILMLAVGASRHYGWHLGPDALAGLASKALGAAAILCLLALLYERMRYGLPVFVWWAWEETQVLLCTTWFMVEPWPVAPGQAICSAKVGFDIGAVGILVVAFMLYRYCHVLQVPKDQK